MSETKRGRGRPPVTDRKPSDGHPKIQFRLDREQFAQAQALGGNEWARQIVTQALSNLKKL